MKKTAFTWASLIVQECAGIKGEVDPLSSGKGKLIDVEVTINSSLVGKSLQETVAHEGSHVGDDIGFLTSYNFGTGKYDLAANMTHGQTEFDAFQTGAGVTREHGFGPHDDPKDLGLSTQQSDLWPYSQCTGV